MARTKEISELAKATGYDPKFLKQVWKEMKKDGNNDFQLFRDITLERDW